MKIGALEKEWWPTSVDPDLNAVEVLELVERDFPDHPALPLLRKAAQGFEKARKQGPPERTFLCPACQDHGWRETDSGGRGVVERCRGAMASGCRYLVHRRAEAAKVKARDGKKTSGEGAEL